MYPSKGLSRISDKARPWYSQWFLVHFAGSVLTGQNDNSVLFGHRDTVFRKLGDVGVNDLLIVTMGAGKFTYKVRKVRIVHEDDRTVIVPKPRATLTISTCYPFDFIGSAPERYILVANWKVRIGKIVEALQNLNRSEQPAGVLKNPSGYFLLVSLSPTLLDIGSFSCKYMSK